MIEELSDGDIAVLLVLLEELREDSLEVLSDSEVVHGLLQILGNSRVTIGLSEEFRVRQVALNLLKELGHSDVVGGEELSDRNVVFGLLQELSYADVVLSEEFGNGNIISDLLEVLSDLIVQELRDSHVVGGSQILGDVLHIGLQNEDVKRI